MKFDLKKLLPHIIAVVSFLVVALLYCKPTLDGKVNNQHDVLQYEGSSKDIADYVKKHGEAPLWTNNMFSGMPTYQIWMPSNNFLPHLVNNIFTLGLPQPIQFFFLACVMFYFLSQVLRINPYIGILGAFSFAFATYNPVIISAGHVTKMWCISYMPALLASVILIYRRQYWWGLSLTALFTATIVGLNHLQVTYYLFLVLVFLTIGFIAECIRTKAFAHLLKALALALIGGLIGVAVNAVTMLTTYEYSKETIRGGSVSLKDTAKNSSGGLTQDYAFQYSIKPAETFVLVTPKIYGGSNGIREFGENSKTAEVLGEMPQQLAQQLYGVQNAYWGGLEMTSGPAYVGVLACILFLMGLFVLDGKYKWWVLAVSLLGILMSWGKFFLGFNDFLFHHLPLYNKFRAPSMSLVIPQLTFPFLAILTLQEILFTKGNRTILLQKLKKAGIAIAALFVVLFLLNVTFDYMDEGLINLKKQVSQQDQQIKEPVYNLVNAVVADRKSMFMGDILKALAIAAVFFGLVWLYLKNRLNALVVIGAGVFLVLVDLLPVGNTYLFKTAGGEEAFVEKEASQHNFSPGKADEAILKDKAWYRVLNLSVSPFNDATTSYFHKSLGGYHAAKIGKYQDLFENKITTEIDSLYKSLNRQDASVMGGLPRGLYTAMSMLNTKYIIFKNPEAGSQEQEFHLTNNNTMGPVWFVKNLTFHDGLGSEMKALTGLDPSETAVLGKEYEAKATQPLADSSASIRMLNNDNDVIEYEYTAATPQFAVFSEVYYSEGWTMYVDGKRTDYFRTNYVLRGANLPAGQHKVTFRFEPASFKTGKSVTGIAQVLVILLLVFAAVMQWRNRGKAVA
jgi:hypothetical protein